VRVWAVGDGADGGAAARAVAARMARLGLDRLLYLGDVYETGTLPEFARHYRPVYGRFTNVTAPTPGNHEWPNHVVGYDTYWRRRHGRTPPPYYALRIAGWQVLSLNSQIAHGPGSPQLRWLRARVRGGGNCRIAFWHRPRFSAGVHGDAPDMAPLWDALRHRARIVLSGHDHDMQRFRPLAGITEFVSGAGGHRLYPVHAHPGLAFADASHFGALRLILRPGHAAWAFITAGGRTLDRGSLTCTARR
jgi:hypothetical protein